MSAFPAGSIVGHLGLDVSEFAESIRESSSLAGTFAAEIGHILSEATGSPMLGELANGISEIVAAASTNNAWETFAAAIHTGGAAVGGFIEMLKRESEAMHEAGLAAEKYGTSVEWMSSVGKVAAESGLGMDALGMSLKFMLDKAANAVDGDKGAIRAFGELGIRAKELGELMRDPEEMMYRIANGMAAIPDQAERVQAATDLMGRAGANAIPFLEQGSDKIKEFAADITDMGGTFTHQDAEMGRSIGELSALFSAGIEGIEKVAARPVFALLLNHTDEIKAEMKSLAEYFQEGIPGAIKEVQDAFKGMGPDLPPIARGIEAIGSAAIHVTSALADLYAEVQEGSSGDNGWGEALGEWWGRTQMTRDKQGNWSTKNMMPDDYVYDPTGQTNTHGGPSHGARPSSTAPASTTLTLNITGDPNQVAKKAGEAAGQIVKKHLEKQAATTHLHLQKQIEAHL